MHTCNQQMMNYPFRNFWYPTAYLHLSVREKVVSIISERWDFESFTEIDIKKHFQKSKSNVTEGMVVYLCKRPTIHFRILQFLTLLMLTSRFPEMCKVTFQVSENEATIASELEKLDSRSKFSQIHGTDNFEFDVKMNNLRP